MTKNTNTINTILKTEEESDNLVNKAREDSVKNLELARKEEDGKLTKLKEELRPKFKKILSVADAKIAEKVGRIKKDNKVAVDKLQNISQNQKKQAIDLIIKTVNPVR